MSIQKRRNSLFKSSISIRSIGDSLQSFSDGLVAARRNSDETIKTIRQRNIFKRNSIRNDNKYFRQRQENIKRKAREDELEASSVQGVPKTQGNILAKSTRGFLGRMLDFIGILIIGWAITNLPKIINAIQGLKKRISSVTGILRLFVDGIQVGIPMNITSTVDGDDVPCYIGKRPGNDDRHFGGYISNDSALAETWNGASWTETGDLNTSRYYF